jgi:hypothetical protein
VRVNVYSQELLTDGDVGVITVESGSKDADTDVRYSYVRQYLHGSSRLHAHEGDDDRSAITWWLPKSQQRREELAGQFEAMAAHVRNALPETGLD